MPSDYQRLPNEAAEFNYGTQSTYGGASGPASMSSHSHANEQIVWMLKGKMEFRLGSEQRVCGPGDVVVIPGVAEHEGWFREDTEVIDFFPPPRDDFLLGGKPAYMSEG